MVISSTTLSALTTYNSVRPTSNSRNKEDGRAVQRKEKEQEERRRRHPQKKISPDDENSTIVIYA